MAPAHDSFRSARTEEVSLAEAREDAALMMRVRAGDEAAFAALLARWELPLKRVIARIVLNASEAEDLAQETMVRVWSQRQKFRPDAAFRPWIFSIAVNLARNRLRWWRRRYGTRWRLCRRNCARRWCCLNTRNSRKQRLRRRWAVR